MKLVLIIECDDEDHLNALRMTVEQGLDVDTEVIRAGWEWFTPATESPTIINGLQLNPQVN